MLVHAGPFCEGPGGFPRSLFVHVYRNTLHAAIGPDAPREATRADNRWRRERAVQRGGAAERPRLIDRAHAGCQNTADFI